MPRNIQLQSALYQNIIRSTFKVFVSFWLDHSGLVFVTLWALVWVIGKVLPTPILAMMTLPFYHSSQISDATPRSNSYNRHSCNLFRMWSRCKDFTCSEKYYGRRMRCWRYRRWPDHKGPRLMIWEDHRVVCPHVHSFQLMSPESQAGITIRSSWRGWRKPDSTWKC